MREPLIFGVLRGAIRGQKLLREEEKRKKSVGKGQEVEEM
jgi:hypothetical protein